jgi:AcrR family transcriptional regulator
VPAKTRSAERREDALSRDRIVGAAIELLDRAGEGGLTFRALSAQLRTGAGAIYWHVANKNELLVAATDAVLAGAMGAQDAGTPPAGAIRAIALGLFDAMETHPWIGTQLTGVPSSPAVLRILERLGRQVQALGVPAPAQFDSATALLNYILGVGGQNAAYARSVAPTMTRTEFLSAVADQWAGLDPDEFPFIRGIAGWLRDHDDRRQFLAGIDLITAGIAGRQPAPSQGDPSGVIG